LDEAGIEYQVVDADESPQVSARIVAKTGGYRVVPTVEIEGELLVNPSVRQVREALGG
jgi:glutaredoxin